MSGARMSFITPCAGFVVAGGNFFWVAMMLLPAAATNSSTRSTGLPASDSESPEIQTRFLKSHQVGEQILASCQLASILAHSTSQLLSGDDANNFLHIANKRLGVSGGIYSSDLGNL
jgi:hypothetical protein